MKYTLTTRICRHLHGISGQDAVVGFDFECPFPPFIGLQVTALDGNVGGTVATAWWDANAQQLHLYTEEVKPIRASSTPDITEADFLRAVKDFLSNGYLTLNPAAQRVADLMGASEQ